MKKQDSKHTRRIEFCNILLNYHMPNGDKDKIVDAYIYLENQNENMLKAFRKIVKQKDAPISGFEMSIKIAEQAIKENS